MFCYNKNAFESANYTVRSAKHAVRSDNHKQFVFKMAIFVLKITIFAILKHRVTISNKRLFSYSYYIEIAEDNLGTNFIQKILKEIDLNSS